MTTGSAHFEVQGPDGTEYDSKYSKMEHPFIGPQEYVGDIPFEKGDSVIWFAGEPVDFHKYYGTSGYTGIYYTSAGAFQVSLHMAGVCNGYVQHNDKYGQKFSQKSVHAPNTLNETMNLSAGEAMIIHHSY